LKRNCALNFQFFRIWLVLYKDSFVKDAKEQKIVVLLSLQASDKNLILNGIKVASIFRKELCLLYNYSKMEQTNLENLKLTLNQYIVPILNELPGLKVTTLLVSEKLSVLPEKLADDYEAIMFVARFSEFKKYASAIAESSIPFLFVNDKIDEISTFKKIILPIDLRGGNSETALWSSYFGRFNQAGIVVVAANDKNKDEHQQVNKNVYLSKKLFLKFKLEHKIFKGTKSSFRNAFEALEIAQSSQSDLMIMLGSSSITPLNWIVGLPERKIIDNAGNLPVLIVNPRKDNYILCD